MKKVILAAVFLGLVILFTSLPQAFSSNPGTSFKPYKSLVYGCSADGKANFKVRFYGIANRTQFRAKKFKYLITPKDLSRNKSDFRNKGNTLPQFNFDNLKRTGEWSERLPFGKDFARGKRYIADAVIDFSGDDHRCLVNLVF